ncbi:MULTISPECIES: DUF2799 domain-containing protein [unclassified Brevundimonas]|uniref:DUF2799 domain-containing protein n=1 Tax=unclassified Brevundimonas TaxID=2622653 RepID=UPI001ADEBBD1|nr:MULTISPECIES: DUF2799 domain-containing protein [unclassified Brevundimonas]
MRSVLLAAGAMLLMGGCASMNEDQCRAGDWGGQGYRDGERGFPMERLDAHAKACSKYGIAPEPAPYRSAREDGLRGYCRFERGFDAGRRGENYHGVCRLKRSSPSCPPIGMGFGCTLRSPRWSPRGRTWTAPSPGSTTAPTSWRPSSVTWGKQGSPTRRRIKSALALKKCAGNCATPGDALGTPSARCSGQKTKRTGSASSFPGDTPSERYQAARS